MDANAFKNLSWSFLLLGLGSNGSFYASCFRHCHGEETVEETHLSVCLGTLRAHRQQVLLRSHALGSRRSKADEWMPGNVRSEELVDEGGFLGDVIHRRAMSDVGEDAIYAKECSQAGVLPGWHRERTSLLHWFWKREVV